MAVAEGRPQHQTLVHTGYPVEESTRQGGAVTVSQMWLKLTRKHVGCMGLGGWVGIGLHSFNSVTKSLLSFKLVVPHTYPSTRQLALERLRWVDVLDAMTTIIGLFSQFTSLPASTWYASRNVTADCGYSLLSP